MKIAFTLNGAPVSVEAPADISLLHLLRDILGLTGTKEGCGVGECGACSVILDGRLVNACLVLAPQASGRSVTTIEGVRGTDGGPNDLQQQFHHPRRGPVRLLHPGHGAGGRSAAGPYPGPRPGRDPRRHRRQPLPLHGLSADRGCDRGDGAAKARIRD